MADEKIEKHFAGRDENPDWDWPGSRFLVEAAAFAELQDFEGVASLRNAVHRLKH